MYTHGYTLLHTNEEQGFKRTKPVKPPATHQLLKHINKTYTSLLQQTIAEPVEYSIVMIRTIKNCHKECCTSAASLPAEGEVTHAQSHVAKKITVSPMLRRLPVPDPEGVSLGSV